MKNFKLLKAMDNANYDVKKLADLTAKTERAVKSWVNGERNPDKLTQSRINRILKTNVYEVM